MIELTPAKTGAAFKITLVAADGDLDAERPETERTAE